MSLFKKKTPPDETAVHELPEQHITVKDGDCVRCLNYKPVQKDGFCLPCYAVLETWQKPADWKAL